MIMPLVASLLAPVMLAASTFNNVVGTVYRVVETSSVSTTSSVVIATPSASFDDLVYRSVTYELTLYLGNTPELDAVSTGYGFEAYYSGGENNLEYSVSLNPDYALVVLPSDYKDGYLTLADSAYYNWSEESYAVYFCFSDYVEYAYYLPASSYEVDESTHKIDFDVDALTGTLPGNDIVNAVTEGLDIVPHLGGSLNDGFDAVFMNNGTLTVVGLFAFTLMGLGIGVGVVKKVLNWITGRHGM